MIVGTVAVITVVVLWLWVTAPRDEERYLRLTPRQERKYRRLAELDKARAELIAELGIEPTPAELWAVTPPEKEQSK